MEPASQTCYNLPMRYVFLFALLVIVLSSAELLLLLEVATRTSFLTALLLCVLTGLVGGTLIRWQGLATLARLRKELAQGHLPADEIIGGFLLLVMGVLLCVPGFITDSLGFLIVVPAVRNFVSRALRKKIEGALQNGNLSFTAAGQMGEAFSRRRHLDDAPRTVDAEFTVEDEDSRRS